MFNSLLVKVFVPILTLMVALGASLYFVALRTVNEFAGQQIENDLEYLTHDLFNIIDHEFMQLIKEGNANDLVAVRISQVDCIDILERSTLSRDFQLIIIEHSTGTVRLATDLPKQVNMYEIIQFLQAEKYGTQVTIADQEFHLRQFYFSPWDWSVLVLKNKQTYSELSQKVHSVYQKSALVLFAVTILLLLFLLRSIKNPIDSIISSVSHGKSPDYKGTFEFEFLSQEISIMRTSLQSEVAERKRAEKVAGLANQAKSEFLTNMSHELRTPLNAILGFAQIMERNLQNSSNIESLNIIQRSGNHLLTLINQVLDLSKIEAGHIILEKNCFDLFHLLDEMESMLMPKSIKKELTLTFDISRDVPRYICTDEIKLRQVLINLIINAIKFTKEGFVLVRISLQDQLAPGITQVNEELQSPSCSNSDCLLRFDIEDSGVGISPAEINNLFKAFGQASSGITIGGGTGLGLAISKNFVHLLGGEIYLKSEKEQGSTFSFNIPVQKVSKKETTLALPMSRVIGVEPGQPSYRMLIVDDKWDNRLLLVRLLDSYGLELREAENGQEALDIQEAWEPDLIWMDIRMPGIDGLEVTKRIRAKTSQTKQPVIIAMTAGVLLNTRETLLESGCNDIIFKPFTENVLFEMLQQHLNIKFVYESEAESPDSIDHTEEKLNLSPSDFTALPEEIILQLNKSIRALKMNETLGVIQRIKELNEPLADTLQKLVVEYRFDILQELLDQVEQS